MKTNLLWGCDSRFILYILTKERFKRTVAESRHVWGESTRKAEGKKGGTKNNNCHLTTAGRMQPNEAMGRPALGANAFDRCPAVAAEGEAERAATPCDLQVQVRTRDGRHRSSLVAPLTPPLQGSFASCTWNSHGSSPLHPALALAGAPQETPPPVTASQALLREPLPAKVVHRGLHGKCRFILFPPLPSCEPQVQPPIVNTFPLFIGQVRFETTPAELIWLFRRASGASAVAVEGRGNGCFILHLKSESERAVVRQLHKRILFDIGGVWLARSLEEVDYLCEYVAIDGPYLSKNAKLPRDSMVVEDIKTDTGDAGHSYPFYHQDSSSYSFGFNSNAWGCSSSRSTPSRAIHNSRSPSPFAASLSQGPGATKGSQNQSQMAILGDLQL